MLWNGRNFPCACAQPPGITATKGYPFGTVATPVLDIYEDFQCPSCDAFEKANGARIEALATGGKAKVVYHMVATDVPLTLRVKVQLAGVNDTLPTLSGIWASANWQEREVWDLFGIVFDGHPKLERLLTPDDWEGHPLRKDYPVQVKLPVRTYEPLQLTQEEFKANVEADRKLRHP